MNIPSISYWGARSSRTYTCPACKKCFSLKSGSGLYGAHPSGFDDVFILVLCNECAHITKASRDDPERRALKQLFEDYANRREKHPLHGALALTSMKILEVYSGDIVQAIELGWPFPKAMHHYDVSSMFGGGIVLVSEKDGDHDEPNS
jgi:hypothetical protein